MIGPNLLCLSLFGHLVLQSSLDLLLSWLLFAPIDVHVLVIVKLIRVRARPSRSSLLLRSSCLLLLRLHFDVFSGRNLLGLSNLPSLRHPSFTICRCSLLLLF